MYLPSSIFFYKFKKQRIEIMTQVFEHLGYSLEYYVDGKYIGSIKTDQKPTSFGYDSRQYYIAENSFQLTNAMGKVKTIKKGSRYYTEAIRLCGKVLGSHKRKVELFRNSKAWKNA
jgi:hypothetical protein